MIFASDFTHQARQLGKSMLQTRFFKRLEEATMRETEIEKHLKDTAESRGGASYKWVCPATRGVPDQIVMMKIPVEHRALIARYLRFVEVKAYEEKPRGQQELRHADLRALGFRVDVVDTKFGADELVRSMG